jgi:pilus assembly protein CpaE
MTEKTRVLIIDHDPDTRYQVQQLAGHAGFDVCGQAGLGTEAVALATDARPGVILCGLKEPIVRVQHTIESLADNLPEVPVIVYAEHSDLEVVRKAMLAGARDFLKAPFNPDELLVSVTDTLDSEERRRLRRSGGGGLGPRGSIITVFGAKGGVGKTTVATNLAVALARHAQQTTVLVDADDAFGDTAPTLALLPEGTVTEALRSIDGDDGQDNGVEKCFSYHGSGLAVLSAPESPFEWKGITGDQMTQLLRHLARRFDAVLVDTGGTLSEVSLAALEAASLVLWITTPEYTSVRDALHALRAVQDTYLPVDRIRVVLNIASPEVEVRPGIIEEALARDIFWTIPYDRELRASAQLGRSLVDDPDPKSPAASSLRDLARALNGASPESSKGGLLRRVSGARNGGFLRRRRFGLKVVEKEVKA